MMWPEENLFENLQGPEVAPLARRLFSSYAKMTNGGMIVPTRMSATSPHVHIYHVAGLDDRDRGFSRQIHVIPREEGFQARLRYESLQIDVDPVPTEDQVLNSLIHVLHERGYRQLRTQRIFIGEQYLGSQELWVEYPDPEAPLETRKNWLDWIRRIVGRSLPS